MHAEQLAQWIAPAAYPLEVVVLLGCGVGLPFSEDVLLVAAGYLAGRDITSLLWTFVVCYPCVLAGDILLYEGGRRLEKIARGRKRLQRILSSKRRAFVEKLFQRWGVLAVAMARQIIGVRSPAFVLAGTARMPRVKFVVTDVFAAAVSTPAFVMLGWGAGRGVGTFAHERHWLELALLGLAVLVGGFWILGREWLERRRAKV